MASNRLYYINYYNLDANVCYSLGTSLNYMGKRVFSILKVESKCIIDALIHTQR